MSCLVTWAVGAIAWAEAPVLMGRKFKRRKQSFLGQHLKKDVNPWQCGNLEKILFFWINHKFSAY